MAKWFLCPIGNEKLEQRTDKHGHPYFVCDVCGVQLFVRGQQGIKNLAELRATLREHDFVFERHTAVLWEIQSSLEEIRGVKEEIKKLESVFDIFSSDADKKCARELLQRRIETVLERLARIANGDDTVQTR